jgi:HEAT repeat protein
MVRSLCLLAVVACSMQTAASQDEDRRKIRALREWGRQGSPAIPRIVPYLADAGLEVRLEAVKALVAIGGLDTLGPLAKALEDNDTEIQLRATDGLVNFYVPGYVQSGGVTGSLRRAGGRVQALLSAEDTQVIDPDVRVRPEIAAGLGRLASGGAPMEVRANAARALGILRGRAAIPDLVQALRSKDDRLMFEALIALQKIRDRDAGPRAVFLIRDLDPKIQKAAIETAGILGAAEAVPDLKRVLETSPDKRIRRAALAALGQIGDAASRPLFLQYLKDRDEGMRAAAAEGLARTGSADDRGVAEQAFEHESRASARVSLAFAAAALGNLETSEFAPLRYLVNNLNSKAWRGVALPLLTELAARQPVRAALYPVLGEALTREEKTGLARVLAGAAAADATGPLEKLAKDEDAATATEALRALRIVRASQ